jgi:hypothetical protein
MPSYGMLCRVAFVRSDVLEERIPSIFRVTGITANVVPSSPIFVILMIEVILSSEASVINESHTVYIPDDRILHIHCSGSLKSYKVYLMGINICYFSSYLKIDSNHL